MSRPRIFPVGSNTRQRRKLAGLCLDCGNTPMPGKIRCQPCSDTQNKNRKTLYAKRAGGGKCDVCGADKESKGYRCLPCKQKINTPRRLERQKEYRGELRAEIVKKYGGKCVCCGEDELIFLELDHINNDGFVDRRHKKMHGGPTFYHSVKNAGFPVDRFQLLCANCNRGKHLNGGVCPHKSRTQFSIAA